MATVNPPPQIKLPRKLQEDRETRVYFDHLTRMFLQLWYRTGGAADEITVSTEESIDNSLLVSQLKSRVCFLESKILELEMDSTQIRPQEKTDPEIVISNNLHKINQRIKDIEAQI